MWLLSNKALTHLVTVQQGVDAHGYYATERSHARLVESFHYTYLPCKSTIYKYTESLQTMKMSCNCSTLHKEHVYVKIIAESGEQVHLLSCFGSNYHIGSEHESCINECSLTTLSNRPVNVL